MTARIIDVVNKSSAPDDAIEAGVVASQAQLTNHVQPAWQHLVPDTITLSFQRHIRSGNEGMYVINVATVPGAEGWHTYVHDNAIGYIAVETTEEAGDNPLGTGSHEAVEEYGDRLTNWYTTLPSGLIVAVELCDAVEAYSYPVDGTPTGAMVSDFQFPAWFGLQNAPGTSPTKYDYMDLCTAPGQLLKGGYTLYKDAAGDIQQQFYEPPTQAQLVRHMNKFRKHKRKLVHAARPGHWKAGQSK